MRFSSPTLDGLGSQCRDIQVRYAGEPTVTLTQYTTSYVLCTLLQRAFYQQPQQCCSGVHYEGALYQVFYHIRLVFMLVPSRCAHLYSQEP